jgi:very-short-patch-repair endonuclease
MKWTKHDIEKMQAAGKIRGFIEHPKRKDKICPKNGAELCKQKKASKEKAWIDKNLWAWCIENGFLLLKEVKFHPSRKWRFDYAIEDLQVAIEYEGLMSKKSRHTTISGFTGDTEKYNEAQSRGWKVLRYTAINYKELITDLNKIL